VNAHPFSSRHEHQDSERVSRATWRLEQVGDSLALKVGALYHMKQGLLMYPEWTFEAPENPYHLKGPAISKIAGPFKWSS
jgi:hypothetical protein